MASPTSLRLWIVVLALMAACGGFGAGYLVRARIELQAREDRAAPGPFGDYVRLLEDHFELSPERLRYARLLLSDYEGEIVDIESRHLAEAISSMQPELERRGHHYRRLLRDHVLPLGARPEFDALLGGKSFSDPH